MMAHSLVTAGQRVLLVERGDWVARGAHNWQPDGSMELTPHYSNESPYRLVAGGYKKTGGATFCVGGPSVFYGCVAFRFRERDFTPDPNIVADSGAAWPFRYADLEPYYSAAEQLLGISGDDEPDPTRPPRSAGYPQPAPPRARISARISDAARALGLNPFSLPMAINHRNGGGRTACEACRTCDTFACAVSAKNDLATCVLPPLVERGLELATNTVAVRLVHEGGRIAAVECFDKQRGEIVTHRAERFIVSGGTLASPHLLLASGLHELNPAGHLVGRNLMRHCNGMVFGLFPRRPDPDREFHKQLAIHDYYFGDDERAPGFGKLGGMQQVMTPPPELVKAHLPWGLRTLLSPLVEHLTGLLVMAEDQPRYDNHVAVDWEHKDAFGLPQLRVETRYTKRDKRARKLLARRAKRVLRKTGAWLHHTHEIKTFSHAVGTVRAGTDPEQAPLDEFCKFRGLDNLYVVDGSFMPTSAGLNPSLTIAANALRVGDYLANEQR